MFSPMLWKRPFFGWCSVPGEFSEHWIVIWSAEFSFKGVVMLPHQIGYSMENIHEDNQADWVAGGDQQRNLPCPSRGNRDRRVHTHRFIETGTCRRSVNSERIVQHRTHIHALNPFTGEETINHWLQTWICKWEGFQSPLCHALEIQS
jgi:hypothetical protein